MITESPVSRTTAEERQTFHQLKARIHRQMIDAIDLSKASRLPEQEFRNQLRALAAHFCDQQAPHLVPAERESLVREVLHEIHGYGPIEPLMSAPGVSEILINGPDRVLVERNGRLEPTHIRFADTDHLMHFIQRLVGRAGGRINAASPVADAKLPDGSRLHAVIPPLSPHGPTVSIHRPRNQNSTLEDLVRTGSLTSEMADFLIACVQARMNILISGKTGAGKTTILDSIGRFISASERIVTIEQTAELQLPQQDVVGIENPPSIHGDRNEIGLRELFQNALRMHPDRIIFGEVSEEDARDLLQAMTAGHDGSMATIQANDARQALDRWETLIAQSGAGLPALMARESIASAVQILIHTTRLATGERKVARISELRGCMDGVYQLEDIFLYRLIDVDHDLGRARGAFYATGYEPQVLKRLACRGYELPSQIFRAQELSGRKEYQSLV